MLRKRRRGARLGATRCGNVQKIEAFLTTAHVGDVLEVTMRNKERQITDEMRITLKLMINDVRFQVNFQDGPTLSCHMSDSDPPEGVYECGSGLLENIRKL
jgi:hypothetical protein